MKLICTQENLHQALNTVERAVGKQGTLPILGNILLETENGRLKLSATNLEIGIVVWVGAKVEKEGKITISAKLLGNFVTNLPVGEMVHLESDEQSLRVVSGQYQVKIKGLEATEFPIIPEYKEGKRLSLPAQAVKEALGHLLPCIALHEARIELTGVYVSLNEKGLFLAATDSFRLGEEWIEIQNDNNPHWDSFKEQGAFIVPAQTFSELTRVIGPEHSAVNMIFEENQLFFEVEGVRIISRLINGRFPDYKQIIPENFALQVFIAKEMLQRAIRIASIFTSSHTQEVVLRFQPKEGTLMVMSRSQEVGENQTTLPGKFLASGEEKIDFVFNPRVALDGLNALETETVAFLANESATPVALKSVEENDAIASSFVYIMMPIRT